MRTPRRCFGSDCRWRAYVEALTVTAFLFSIVFLIACTPSKIHNLVLDPETPESLETTAPIWVEEFANSMATVDGPQPHVLLISLDTLRADHLGAWGYDRPTSPFLDELARLGVRFDQALSHSPKTAPSHMSVFTGAFPSEHGAHFEYKTVGGRPVVFPVRRDLLTLAEVMHRAGYRTAAWTGGGQLSRSAGFARGFDRFLESFGKINPDKMQEIRTWFRRHSNNPCFMFLHTYQIHDPYLPPSPYNTVFSSPDYGGWVIGDRKTLGEFMTKEKFHSKQAAFWRKTDWGPNSSRIGPEDLRQLVGLYDGGIRYTDDVLHGFFKDLFADGLLENTLIVIFSDHGEEFLEHGGVLHKMLYRETVHVPLIFFWPGHINGGVVVSSQVPLMDLTPTLLELVGLEAPQFSNAHSLLPLIKTPDAIDDREVYSEAPWAHGNSYHRSLRNATHLLYDLDHDIIQLYSTENDTLELEDISTEDPEVAAALYREMVAYLDGRSILPDAPQETASELTNDEVEALRALGYVR
jgi:arylsulfatase A-like enzyme